MKKSLHVQAHHWLVIFSTIFAIVINIIAIILPLNNKSTQQLSDQYPIPFTPAGFVFSIWSLIYLGLIAYTVYQFITDAKLITKMNPWFIFSNILNGMWIFAWHYEILWLSVLIILTLLVTLIRLYLYSRESQNRLAVRHPLSLYLGWISVATVANISVLLYDIGWSGWGFDNYTWTGIMMVVATLLGATMLARFQDVVFALVIVWCLYGITYKNSVFFPLLIFCFFLYTTILITQYAQNRRKV